MRCRHPNIKRVCGSIAVVALLLLVATVLSLRPIPETLSFSVESRAQIYDRFGTPLALSYSNDLNPAPRPLHSIPLLLQQAVIRAEDKRFYRHSGIDWLARTEAIRANVRALRVIRGARTISEQVIRILHPRPSSLWTRWLEGFEALILERRFSKAEILEFYLNQVPFSRQRRGVDAAARLYFARDLQTLSTAEILSLAVLIRAPSRLEKAAAYKQLDAGVKRLHRQLVDGGFFKHPPVNNEIAAARVHSAEVRARLDRSILQVPHFVRYVRGHIPIDGVVSVSTTINGPLQDRVQRLLDTRVADLRQRNVKHAAALVVDNQTGEVLAWANAGGTAIDQGGSHIDAALTPRQAGSTLKPFLYAMALEQGWHAATILDDSPLNQAIRGGLHQYSNYSRIHYGPVRLRDALGNSLNIPAIQTIRFIGPEAFLQRLHLLGFTSLNRSVAEYGEGLALGNGEVSLFELVQAYMALARGGSFIPLRTHFTLNEPKPVFNVFSPEVSSLVADILADPNARRREFGEYGVLRLPSPTAVKTGTSNDFRDSWAVGFSDRYTVGVWMGNLDRSAMDEISGARGPALVLRGVFQRLQQESATKPLPLSLALEQVTVCSLSGKRAGEHCPEVQEWFLPNNHPKEVCQHDLRLTDASQRKDDLKIVMPTWGLTLATDPRLTASQQAVHFRLNQHPGLRSARWYLNGEKVAETGAGEFGFLWQLQTGAHNIYAEVDLAGQVFTTETIPFTVR